MSHAKISFFLRITLDDANKATYADGEAGDLAKASKSPKKEIAKTLRNNIVHAQLPQS